MVCAFFYRYPNASASPHTWDKQKDDRGLKGLIRFLGKGTNSPQHNQR